MTVTVLFYGSYNDVIIFNLSLPRLKRTLNKTQFNTQKFVQLYVGLHETFTLSRRPEETQMGTKTAC